MGDLNVLCLLDTHTLLWALADPPSLGREARQTIEDPSVTLRVSAASAWELATKQRLGRLPQADVIIEGLPQHIRRLGAASLPITMEHATLAGRLDWAHRDPFDRMLAAQAMVESMPLISKDAAFDTLSGIRTIW